MTAARLRLSSPAPPPPDEVTIDSFNVSPSTIESGETVTVSWQTSNATSVTLNGSSVFNDGSQTFTPDSGHGLRSKGLWARRPGDRN